MGTHSSATAVLDAPVGAATLVAERKEPESPNDRYLRELRGHRSRLRVQAARAEQSGWKYALTAANAITVLEREFEEIRSREQMYSDLSEGQPWTRGTIKKRAGCVEWLDRHDLGHVARSPVSGFHQIADIVNSGLTDKEKSGLVIAVYEHDVSHGRNPYTVRDIRQMILAKRPSPPRSEEDLGRAEFLDVKRCDDRFGHPGYARRLPGQVIVSFLRQWLPAGGSVLSVFAADGAVLDAAAHCIPGGDHRGVDLEIDDSVAGRYPRPTTPRIAEFAEDAVVFRQAWSPANWTGPAHASLFTGLVPQRHGFHRGSRPYLLGGLPVLAEEFARSGYATACFTNNEVVSPELGLTRGFGTLDLRFRDEARPYPWAAATHEAAARWAQEQAAAGRPFFLFVNDVEPHQTYDPPAGDAARFLRDAPDDREIAEARAFRYPRNLACDAGAETIDERGMALLSDLYDAEIAALDREVGVLLDRLRASGLLDSTVVVLVADHGEQFGEHGLVEHSVGLYAPVCHVPLVVRWPGRFDGGRVEDDVVRLEDVAPTLLELCMLPPLAGIDGRSLTRGLPGRVARAMQPAHDWWVAVAGTGARSCEPLRRCSRAGPAGRHSTVGWTTPSSTCAPGA